MFLETSPIYSDSSIQESINTPLIIKRLLMKKERNVSQYTDLEVFNISSETLYSDSNFTRKLNPTHEKLKRAMFNASKKGLLKSL
jgi:hypothetical protein